MRNIGFIVFILVLITIVHVGVNNILIDEKQERLDTRKAGYEQGYETGALCGSKFGYDDCMEILKRVK